MMFRTKKKLGNSYIEIEGETLKQLCAFASQVPAIEMCNCCQGQNLTPNYREVQGNTYFSIKCDGCGAEYKLGQLKQGGLLYYKYDTVFEKYEGKKDDGTVPVTQTTQADTPPDGMPF